MYCNLFPAVMDVISGPEIGGGSWSIGLVCVAIAAVIVLISLAKGRK